jgi:murein DD-endopeptidase MepM/ murein hydrolase activator NlpD
MVSVFKNLFVHFRTWIKFLLILAVGLGIIFFIVFSAYKPMYTVSLNGEILGYIEDKSELQDKISKYMKSGNSSANIAFVDIENLPEYSFCLLKRDHDSNEDEIFDEIIQTGITYYKYYAIMVDSEEKYYVSEYSDCEKIIQDLNDKDSDNVDEITYVVKYEQELKEFTETDTVVADLYVKKVVKPTVSASTTLGSVATSTNVSYASVDLGGISFINPISGTITSRFGAVSSIRSSAHTGLDIGTPIGTPVAVAASGTVVYSGWKGSYGKLITVDHGNGVLTYYAHCDSLYKNVGEVVSQGDIIAASGNTGNSTGPHLHIEVRVNGVAYNPQYYFNY